MERIEAKIINLTEAVCRLHFYDDIDATAAIAKLNEKGFPDVSIKFVQTIYERAIKETDKTMTVSYKRFYHLNELFSD
jgi:hypothetical protein